MKKIASHGKAGAQVGVDKTDTAYAAQNEMLSFNPLFGSDEVKLKMTPEAVTPFAAMASFFFVAESFGVSQAGGGSDAI